jgi:hypothetical protein
VPAARDPAGLAGGPAGLDRQRHRDRHPPGVGRLGDRGGDQHGGAAELHRQRRVAGGADAGVEDHRHRRLLDDHRDVVRVPDAEAGTDRRAERHHGGAAGLLEAAGQDRVVVGVRQHGEPVGHEQLGRLEQLDRVRQQGDVVSDDLQLDPVRLQRLAGQPGDQERLGGGVTASGIGQDGDAGLPDGADQGPLR